jgi:hypothetical protein
MSGPVLEGPLTVSVRGCYSNHGYERESQLDLPRLADASREDERWRFEASVCR